MPDSVAVDALLIATIKQAEALRHWPVSTYRIQFHSGFTFRDATAIVPYLARLGITHVYASPYLAATAGSTHGYDVIDHGRLNPELGTDADYNAWLAAMREHGLRHILDTVPNHVGVATNDNAWWNDVLEHGPKSKFARYFDIDWATETRPELFGKVLVPTLGRPYGLALEAGELKLSLDAPSGQFWLNYFERRFPISPETYAEIFSLTDRAAASLPAFSGTNESHGSAFKRQVAEAVQKLPGLAESIQNALAVLNGTVGEPRSFDDLDRLLQKQHFRLADWHVAFDEINYRRFFDVNDLAAIAMERDEVFDAAHALLLAKLATGDISGLRIDHPDGLFDPAAYFLRLQQQFLLTVAEHIFHDQQPTADWQPMRQPLLARLVALDGIADGPKRWPLFVSAEKILAMDEPLIGDWAIQGTSGYDYLVQLNSLFVDPAAEPQLDALWQGITNDQTSYEELAYRNKRQMLESSLASELQALTHRLDELARGDRRSIDFTFRTLQAAIRETISCFGVYRTYITSAGITETDRAHMTNATRRAADRNPLVPCAAFEFLRDVLLQEFFAGADHETRQLQLAFVGKFQQLTSPVTAKGIEDTTFYQYNRFLSLNEVGGEPAVFGISSERLHQFFAGRQRDWPFALSTLSTHDTKRSEDVRARLNGLSDLPGEWSATVTEWFELNRSLRTVDSNGSVSPGPDEEFLIYQTLVGAWPIGDEAATQAFIDRIQAYVLKAIREAKRRTRWGEPNAAHEAAVKAFIDGLFDRQQSAAFYESFLPFVKTVSHFGLINSLSQTLIKLTSPGVPDTYQGTELWDFSLVDPDNRRPVDYTHRSTLLSQIESAPAASLLPTLSDGRLKLKLVQTALQFRRDNAQFFEKADYTPLTFTGEHGQHAFGFVRSWQDKTMAVLVPLRVAQWVDDGQWPVADRWGDTTATNLPRSRWRDLFSSGSFTNNRLATLFEAMPFAFLTAE